MSCSERRKEIKRRRHRRVKLAYFKRKLDRANTSERSAIVEKIRQLTPGYNEIQRNWNLVDQG